LAVPRLLLFGIGVGGVWWLELAHCIIGMTPVSVSSVRGRQEKNNGKQGMKHNKGG